MPLHSFYITNTLQRTVTKTAIFLYSNLQFIRCLGVLFIYGFLWTAMKELVKSKPLWNSQVSLHVLESSSFAELNNLVVYVYKINIR